MADSLKVGHLLLCVRHIHVRFIMTSTVAVTRCAPGPIDPALYFDDLGQFASKKFKIVSAESGISFGDAKYMRVHARVLVRCKRWLPPWAFNDEQLRTVILHRGWSYVHGDSLLPRDITFVEAKRQVDEHFANVMSREWGKPGSKQWAIHEAHVRSVKNAGGYLELLGAVLYKSLRVGRDSVAVAGDLGITPSSVRQIVARANEAAVALGFETFAPSKTAGRPRKRKRKVGRPKGRAFIPEHLANLKAAGRLRRARVHQGD
ncbi:MAG: hypothetical protein LAO08_19135 [Acidobacteriia bacterium]|nr:hypothetical protein [Terriglobia bacterium]